MRAWTCICLLLSACSADPPRGATNSAPPEEPSVAPSGSTRASAPLPPEPPPRLEKKEPHKLTAPIRDNSALGPANDGAALEARLLVSKVTPADGLHLALRFRLDPPRKPDDPRRKATIDHADVLPSLKLEVSGPNGKTTLVTTEREGIGQLSLLSFDLDFGIDGHGAKRFGRTSKWTKPEPDLLSKPGKYTLAIQGALVFADRTVNVALAPLAFEVVAESASFKSLAALTSEAADVVRTQERLKAAPQSAAPVIDDTDGQRWFRFTLDPGDRRSLGHDATVIEVLLDPSGQRQNYDAYPHFSCIAEGMPVETPSGPVPVERLKPGDSVVSFDVSTAKKEISWVRHVAASYAERLVELGPLRVTGAHPVFSDGEFKLASELSPGAHLLRSDLSPLSVAPLVIEQPATVFELSVSEPHTYFAGGLLVHNKARHVPIGGDDQPFRGLFYRRAAKH